MKIEIKNGYIYYDDNPDLFIHESGCVGRPPRADFHSLNGLFKEAYGGLMDKFIFDSSTFTKLIDLENKRNANKNRR